MTLHDRACILAIFPPKLLHQVPLPKNIERFAFILGIERRSFRDQDPVNIEASELMGAIHDALEESGYKGHDLERYLVRLLFIMFADDTGIFDPRDILLDLIESRTRDDGSDVGLWLHLLFEVLNTPDHERQKNLDADLAKFQYVNGDLFAARLRVADFNAKMRATLLKACQFNWSAVSPAIFGSLFQSVMDKDERRKKGAHYTTEKNIMKVIGPLFLDDLRAEFARINARKDNRRKSELEAFRQRLGKLTFFDPACGCGNFLIIAYREMRLLEMDVIEAILRSSVKMMGESRIETLLRSGASGVSVIDVDQFYGIEMEEFPARIAEVAMWMMDHIMNNRFSLAFNTSYARIPLKKSPHIVVGNAIDIEWDTVLKATRCSYVLGNPPFIGHQWRDEAQQADMKRVWGSGGQFNRLDYVTCWFNKSVRYAANNKSIAVAFVSTNSITQGEQCGILWPYMFANGATIRFAHRTFQWNSEARGSAAVHCVIVGLTFEKSDSSKHIYEYEHLRGDPHASLVSQINGYLIEGAQHAVPARSKPPFGRLPLHKGSQPTDGARLKKPGGGYITYSNLILDDGERADLLATCPKAEKWLRPYVGGDELISGRWRWCLWLKDADPAEIRQSTAVQERLNRVRAGRLQSPTDSVREYAKYPTIFTQDRQPTEPYLALPEVSSETREYIPMAVLDAKVVASNKLQIIVGAPLLYFGILTSAMHMAWMRTVGGRLKSDYSYSPSIYNSFPWPEMTPAKVQQTETLAQAVLDARLQFRNLTLDDLYDPDAMPPDLRRAHDNLDKAVDRLYRRSGFQFERERVEHLFSLYEKMAAPIESAAVAKKRRRRPLSNQDT